MSPESRGRCQAYWNFKRCHEERPEKIDPVLDGVPGTITGVADVVARELVRNGMIASNDDRAFELEADLYAYIKASNSDYREVFEAAEKIGSEL